jgi:hypothetical protein
VPLVILPAEKAVRHGTTIQWLLDHETLAVWITGVATGSLAIGVLVAWVALYDAKRTRHAQLVSDFSLRWDSEEILKSVQLGRKFQSDGLAELATKLFGPNAARPPDPENAENWATVCKWSNLLETVGVMVAERNLPRRTVFRMWGGNILSAWTLWAECADAQRDHLNDRDVLQYFGKLAEAMESEREAEERRRNRPGPIGDAIIRAAQS